MRRFATIQLVMDGLNVTLRIGFRQICIECNTNLKLAE